MLPFHAILALLMILISVGCSQKAPPGSIAAQNALQTDKKPLIKPAQETPTPTPSADEVSLAPGDTIADVLADGQWNIGIVGEGAEKLFQTTALEEINHGKTGENYTCGDVEKPGRYACLIQLSAADGKVSRNLSNSELKFAEPTFKPEDFYYSKWNYITINPYAKVGTKTDKGWAGPSAMISFVGDRAMKIFNDLSRPKLQEEIAAGEFSKTQYGAGVRKFGSHVLCEMRPLKDSQTKHYWCTLYLDTSRGAVNPIQLPKTK